MNLPALSIKRHVLAYMLNAVIILFGVVSYQELGVDRFPTIEFPRLSITTVLTGANPDIIDSSITNIVETAVNSVPGIEHIMSQSAPGRSVVSVVFKLDKDIDIAFNEVQSKVNQILRKLPAEADPPVVAKVDFGGTPIMWLALKGDRTLQQLNLYARNTIKKRLETVDGVGNVLIGGERERTIRVQLDPLRMSAFQITTQDLVRAFQNEHFQLPGGYLVDGFRENLIKLDLEFHNLDDLENMLIGYRNSAPIKLKDVAQIEDGLADFRKIARHNGEPTVGLGIIKITGANTVKIADEIKRRLEEELIPQLPAGVTLEISSDNSIYINELFFGLEEHLLMGTLFAALVVWLFLKSFRSTLIIAAAIPVSLLGAVFVMFFAGYTFNVMTMLALLLLIGIVVDDAIVVLENIFRHRETIDKDPESAAINGSNEVIFAVVAATFTLVAIFAGVIFMGGVMGRFFGAFAIVVTFGVLSSLLVSLTLTPMLCARHLEVSDQHGMLYNWLEARLQDVERFYRHALALSLRFRWPVILITIAIVSSSGFFFGQVGKSFMPQEDEGRFIISIKTPLGSSIQYTDDRLAKLEEILKKHPEIKGYFSVIGSSSSGQVNQGRIYIQMVPREERELKQFDLIDLLRTELAEVPGVKAFPAPIPVVGGQRGEPLQFVLNGPNLQTVATQAEALQKKLMAHKSLGKVDLDLNLQLPELVFDIDRVRAASIGLSARDIALAINIVAGGFDVAKFNDFPGDGERYDIRLKAVKGTLETPADLSQIYLRTKGGELVRLDTVATPRETIGPAIISKLDLRYGAYFYTAPTVPLGEAVDIVQSNASKLLPSGYSIKLVGRAEEFSKTIGYMKVAFGMAIILVYMVLASQFNSFIQPLIIMVAQPLAIVGGIFALWLMGHGLNIFSMIGLILLMGLVAKNSILLIDLTNQTRQKGEDINPALLSACPIRLRPVLMTSLTVILAMIPAAMGLGAGAETNGPLAVAVIGGMVSSTLLTLIVVPAVYSLIEHGLYRFNKSKSSE
ncbi:MAG: AcrB/AcrD/AcrF family protein [Gammaproteobacteria bacterium]|nr:MAG: AcrB/AcrD/AcrF family protein [Gammaproteobacteria bacterium]RLA21642.1 MAG: AcrB/AcrD/AcrF family protein [Gammaproteobacteria bacterium]